MLAAELLLQEPGAGHVVGMDMGLERPLQPEPQLVDQGGVAPHLLEHRIDQHRLARRPSSPAGRCRSTRSDRRAGGRRALLFRTRCHPEGEARETFEATVKVPRCARDDNVFATTTRWPCRWRRPTRASSLTLGRGDQVLELLQAGGAHDRRGDRLALHQPGERHLGRAGVVLLAGRVERLQDGQALVVDVLLHAGAARAFAEVGLRPVLAGQEPAASE